MLPAVLKNKLIPKPEGYDFDLPDLTRGQLEYSEALVDKILLQALLGMERIIQEPDDSKTQINATKVVIETGKYISTRLAMQQKGQPSIVDDLDFGMPPQIQTPYIEDLNG